MENKKKYNTEDINGQIVNDNSVTEYNVTIPVTIPTMGGYTFDSHPVCSGVRVALSLIVM